MTEPAASLRLACTAFNSAGPRQSKTAYSFSHKSSAARSDLRQQSRAVALQTPLKYFYTIVDIHTGNIRYTIKCFDKHKNKYIRLLQPYAWIPRFDILTLHASFYIHALLTDDFYVRFSCYTRECPELPAYLLCRVSHYARLKTTDPLLKKLPPFSRRWHLRGMLFHCHTGTICSQR